MSNEKGEVKATKKEKIFQLIADFLDIGEKEGLAKKSEEMAKAVNNIHDTLESALGYIEATKIVLREVNEESDEISRNYDLFAIAHLGEKVQKIMGDVFEDSGNLTCLFEDIAKVFNENGKDNKTNPDTA